MSSWILNKSAFLEHFLKLCAKACAIMLFCAFFQNLGVFSHISESRFCTFGNCDFGNLSFGNLSAAEPSWSWQRDLELAKDEQYRAQILVGNVAKSLVFRWTLWKNQGLVMHIHFDGFNHQVVLYKDYQRNSFKITLGAPDMGLSALAMGANEPSFHIYFKGFADKKANFNLYIKGAAQIVEENL